MVGIPLIRLEGRQIARVSFCPDELMPRPVQAPMNKTFAGVMAGMAVMLGVLIALVTVLALIFDETQGAGTMSGSS